MTSSGIEFATLRLVAQVPQLTAPSRAYSRGENSCCPLDSKSSILQNYSGAFKERKKFVAELEIKPRTVQTLAYSIQTK
jgi:hypothetical protein